jgi:predicted nuclease with TOPRIM domain
MLSVFSYGQIDTLSQAEKNHLKVEELKRKLDALEGDTTLEHTESILPRITLLESRVDSLEARLNELAKTNQQLIEMSQQILAQTKSTNNTINASMTNTSSTFSGKYYVVLESQTKLSNAKLAYDRHTNALQTSLKLVKSSNSNWYYLVIELPIPYAEAKKLQIEYQGKSYHDAWVVASDKVSEL